MGFLDVLAAAAEIYSAFSDNSTHFKLECSSLEIFEIGTIWQGTARTHGAGNHIETKKVSFETELIMPSENESQRTCRDILRDNLLKWASETFAYGKKLPKEAIVLNNNENCLSCEGFIKQEGSKWVITTNINEAKYYGAYKLFISKKGENLGHEDLDYYFKTPTTARVTSVDVHEGF